MSTPPFQQRLPFDLVGKAHPDVVDAIRYAFSGLLDLNEANKVNVASINALKPATSTTTTATAVASTSTTVATAGVTSFNTQTGAVSFFSPLGTVSNQSGETAYTTEGTDAGALIVLSDASAIAITLSATVMAPWFAVMSNAGAGTATLTPASGTISYPGNPGASSMTLPAGALTILFFDATNFFAATTPSAPATIAPVAGEYLTGYNGATGLFSQSTPAGISATITTAKLTTGGANGSQTFTNGILTAQTPAT